MTGWEIHNQRLTLRTVSHADQEALSHLLNDRETVRQSGLQLPDPRDHQAWQWALAMLVDSNSLLVIEEQPHKRLAGLVSLVANGQEYELGYLLFPVFRGHGLMTAAIKLLLDYFAARQKPVIIRAETATDNHASQCVLRRCGFDQLSQPKDGQMIEWGWTSRK